MKLLSLLSILPIAAAFAPAHQVVNVKTTSLHSVLPNNFARAEECAVAYDCDLDELETLADELDSFQHSELQNRDDYKDTEHVLHMLRTQKELKTEMKEYVADHHKETYMDTAWGNNIAGLGSGLW